MKKLKYRIVSIITSVTIFFTTCLTPALTSYAILTELTAAEILSYVLTATGIAVNVATLYDIFKDDIDNTENAHKWSITDVTDTGTGGKFRLSQDDYDYVYKKIDNYIAANAGYIVLPAMPTDYSYYASLFHWNNEYNFNNWDSIISKSAYIGMNADYTDIYTYANLYYNGNYYDESQSVFTGYIDSSNRIYVTKQYVCIDGKLYSSSSTGHSYYSQSYQQLRWSSNFERWSVISTYFGSINTNMILWKDLTAYYKYITGGSIYQSNRVNLSPSYTYNYDTATDTDWNALLDKQTQTITNAIREQGTNLTVNDVDKIVSANTKPIQDALQDQTNTIDKDIDEIINNMNVNSSNMTAVLDQIYKLLYQYLPTFGNGGSSSDSSEHPTIDIIDYTESINKILEYLKIISDSAGPDSNTVITDYTDILNQVNYYLQKIYEQSPNDYNKKLDSIINAIENICITSGTGNTSSDQLENIINLLEINNTTLSDIYKNTNDIKLLLAVDTGQDFLKNLYDILNDDSNGAKNKLPFSIPFDMVAMVTFMKAEPEKPIFDIPISVASIGVQENIHIDLTESSDVTDMSKISFVVRSLLTVLFIFFLIIITRKMFF